MESVNVLILDSHPIIRNALISVLGNIPTITKIFESDSIEDATRTFQKENIDMLILDVQLNDGVGFDFIQNIKNDGYLGKVMFLSSNNNPALSQRARRVGANSFILKTEDSSFIRDAISSTCQGYSIFKSKVIHEYPELTKRELTILKYLFKGYSNQEISELLYLSPKTISTHKINILNKYNNKSILEIMKIEGY